MIATEVTVFFSILEKIKHWSCDKGGELIEK
jgi:hypothetical protein